MFDLTGKVALLTGATGGIGQEIAKALHKQGAEVVLSGTKEQALNELVELLGSRAYPLVCNLKDNTETENLIDNAAKILGKIDILVCNAGITKDSLSMRMKTEDFTEILNVNLVANFILNRNAIKHMIKNKWGRIINVSSIVALIGNPGQANYVASKAALIAMSKTLANEVASRNVTVNCIAPGFIASPMTDVLSEQQKATMLQKIPTARLGQGADIAAGIVYLASEEASYVTGQTIHINGGMLMV
jgi:3-oxoacyl-[acyl-carrier protein] reductase